MVDALSMESETCYNFGLDLYVEPLFKENATFCERHIFLLNILEKAQQTVFKVTST